MATHLDLEEQEQLDEIKHFWKQYGNVITWILIIVLGSFAAWNGYQYWQRNQAAQAAAMLDEVEKTIRSGDAAKIERAFGDMKDRYGSTTYAHQAGLMVGKALFDLGKTDSAKSSFNWVAEKAGETGYAAIAKLRLSGIFLELKAFDEAMKVLDGKSSADFDGLMFDRKGDIYAAQNKKIDAKNEYQKALKTFDERAEYRRLVQVKLDALGGGADK